MYFWNAIIRLLGILMISISGSILCREHVDSWALLVLALIGWLICDLPVKLESDNEPIQLTIKEETQSTPSLGSKQGLRPSPTTPVYDRESIRKDLISGLVNMGIGKKLAEAAVEAAMQEEPDGDFSELFKLALAKRGPK